MKFSLNSTLHSSSSFLNIGLNQVFLSSLFLFAPLTATQAAENFDMTALFSNNEEQQSKKVIVVQGTSDSESILRIIALHFNKKHPDITILVPDGIGSLGGIRSLLSGGADLARTARSFPLENRGGGQEILMIEVPLVFVVHKSVTGINNLNKKQLVKVYSGEINNWSELGGPDEKIYPVSRQAGASSFMAISAFIDKFGQSGSASKIYYSTADVADAVANHEFTIGYLPLTAVVNSNLKVLSLNGKIPTVDTIKTGDYPLKITFYLTMNKAPKEHIKTFVDFATSQEVNILYSNLLKQN